jgi:hypothetical protein
MWEGGAAAIVWELDSSRAFFLCEILRTSRDMWVGGLEGSDRTAAYF